MREWAVGRKKVIEEDAGYRSGTHTFGSSFSLLLILFSPPTYLTSCLPPFTTFPAPPGDASPLDEQFELLPTL